MAKVNFIKQLAELKKNFLAYAKQNSSKVYMSSFEVNIIDKDYLSFRVEALAENKKDMQVFYQEICMTGEEKYQKTIEGENIIIY